MMRMLLISIATFALVAGCENAESVRIEETRSKLVGSWVREGEAGDVMSRRVLVLGADGKFTERILITGSDRHSERKEYSGEWSYDGINFKRRFLQEDGRRFSGGGIRYATFPLVSVGAAEFVVNDNIALAQASYRRAVEGTQP